MLTLSSDASEGRACCRRESKTLIVYCPIDCTPRSLSPRLPELHVAVSREVCSPLFSASCRPQNRPHVRVCGLSLCKGWTRPACSSASLLPSRFPHPRSNLISQDALLRPREDRCDLRSRWSRSGQGHTVSEAQAGIWFRSLVRQDLTRHYCSETCVANALISSR